MRDKILVFMLALAISVSLVNAVKTMTVNETELVSLKPKVSDADADKLAFSFTKPLDENGKWQTKYGDAGEYTITIAASDGQSTTSQDVLLVVKKRNAGPTIDSFEPAESEKTINEGEGIGLSVTASDLNRDVLRYEWVVDGKAVSEKESYSYKADYGDAGEHEVKVSVSDGEETEEKKWKISVSKVDRNALLEGFKDLTVNEGEAIMLELPDFGKYNLEYTISEPIWNDGIWETTYNDSGEYDVEVEMKDRGFSASKMIKVTVKDVDRAAVFKPIDAAWMEENQKVSIELEAYEPDGDNIVFSAESLPRGASLNGNRFEWLTDYDTAKKGNIIEKALDKFHLFYMPFKVVFTAKSRDIEVKRAAWVFVKDVNRAPALEDIPPITVNEGEEVIIKPEASDPDGDEVLYSYSGWMNADRYLTNYNDAGVYKVKVTASDGFLTDEKYITITVNDVNRAPEIKSIASVSVNEGQTAVIKLEANDPDGDSVTVTADPIPKNATIENNVFRWTLDYDAVKADGIVNLNFKASDGKNEATEQASIMVYNVNRVPEIKSFLPKKDAKLQKNKKARFEVNAEDADGDELTYLWKFGLFEEYKAGNSMARTFTTSGEKKIKVIVSDGKESSEREWRVTVK